MPVAYCLAWAVIIVFKSQGQLLHLPLMYQFQQQRHAVLLVVLWLISNGEIFQWNTRETPCDNIAPLSHFVPLRTANCFLVSFFLT